MASVKIASPPLTVAKAYIAPKGGSDDKMLNQADNNIEPRRAIGNSGPAWMVYLLAFFLLIGLGGGLWYLLAPESMARLFGRFGGAPLVVESLSLNLDGNKTLELPPNGTIELHPGQRFGVNGLKSSRWRNYDLRLYSPDIDIKAITDGALSTTRELLPGEIFENNREIHISVRDGDQDVADFRILSRYSALDFLTRGDAANTAAAKAEYYQKAYQLNPSSELIRDKLVSALAEAEVGPAGGGGPQAASIYESLLAQNGPNEDILNRLANIYEDGNKNDRLIAVLERLISLGENRGEIAAPQKERLASAKARLGLFNDAAAVYEELLKLDQPIPRQIIYLGQLVGLYRQNSDSEKEIETLKRLAEIAPPDQAADIWTEITLFYNKIEDTEGRLAALKNLAEKLPEGPPKANTYKTMGNIWAAEEKYDQARKAYQAALNIFPNDANTLLNLARLSLLMKDSKSYLAYLTKAVDLKPANNDYRRELADALAADKQNAKAKSQYQELIKQQPEDQILRLVFIDFLDTIGDKNALIQQYEELAKLNESNKVLPYNLGVIYFEQKKWDKAIESFKKVLALDAGDKEAREYLLVAYQRKNQRADILREAMELYRRDPSNTVYRTLMLNTCENAKDWKEFARITQEITRLEPDSPYGWEQLYRAQTALRQKEAAAESLWQAAERTKEKQSDAWLKAAREFAALGNQKDKARQAYNKVLKIDPNNKTAARALDNLEK